MSLLKYSSFAIFLTTLPVWSQPAIKELTAREIFLETAEVKPVSKPASNIARRPRIKSSVKSAPAAAPSEQPSARDPLSSTAEIAHSESTSPDGTAVVSVVKTESTVPLGIRYVVLKETRGRVDEEVDPDSVFHSRDRIQLDVEVNDSGYLYVINRGSTGTWKMLFPSAETPQGGNHVTRGHQYRIPEQHVIAFDSNTGTENLFIVFSRQPEADLESLIHSLGDKTPKQPASDKGARPAPAGTLMAANVQLDDNYVDGLRRVYSRDLVIEKADASAAESAKSGEGKGDASVHGKDHAVYAVNPTGRPDSRVVSDVTLIHQ